MYFKDFDEKSVEFVEAGISLIEKRFTGSEYLEVPAIPDSITGEPAINPETGEPEKVKLSFFKSIPSQSKVYNKILVPNNQYTKKLNFLKTQRDLQAIANMEKMEELTSSDDEEITVAAALTVEGGDKKDDATIVDAESAAVKKVPVTSSLKK